MGRASRFPGGAFKRDCDILSGFILNRDLPSEKMMKVINNHMESSYLEKIVSHDAFLIYEKWFSPISDFSDLCTRNNQMEPSHSQNLGAAEECHSCESGWTMYLGSPTHDDDEEQEGEVVEDRIRGCDAEDESDDSMASDASSGPSHHRGNQQVKENEIAEKKVEKKEKAFMDQRGIKVEVDESKVRKRK